MTHAITAEELFSHALRIPATERSPFFTMPGGNTFQNQNFSHEKVFCYLANEQFTANEAAEYLEVSVPTFRRYVQGGKIHPSHVVGRNQFFCKPRPEIVQVFAAGRKGKDCLNLGWPALPFFK